MFYDKSKSNNWNSLNSETIVEEFFKVYAGYVALTLEIIAVVLIAIGAIEAIIGLFHPNVDKTRPFVQKKRVWVRLGVWLLLALEFELGADIIRSAISPTWEQIGELATIAVIRTFLNYFLEKDIEKYAETEAEERMTVERATPAPGL